MYFLRCYRLSVSFSASFFVLYDLVSRCTTHAQYVFYYFMNYLLSFAWNVPLVLTCMTLRRLCTTCCHQFSSLLKGGHLHIVAPLFRYWTASEERSQTILLASSGC